MLRALVARTYALHPATIRFTRDPRGAPGLEGLPAFISTAGCVDADGEAWSAVALSSHPVGVDLEPGPATDALMRWTLTEAYLKALGRGLAVAPEDVRIGREACGGGWRLALAGATDGVGEPRAIEPLVAAVARLAPGADDHRIYHLSGSHAPRVRYGHGRRIFTLSRAS